MRTKLSVGLPKSAWGLCIMALCLLTLGAGAALLGAGSSPGPRALSAAEMSAAFGDTCSACKKEVQCNAPRMYGSLCAYCSVNIGTRKVCCSNLGQDQMCEYDGDPQPCGIVLLRAGTPFGEFGTCGSCTSPSYMDYGNCGGLTDATGGTCPASCE
jgi:hypothetical protein